MAVQEDHDLPDDLLLGPGVRDPLGPNRADAGDLTELIGLGLDNVEDLLPKGLDHLLGVDRADAADHPGAQIFLDPVDGARGRGLEKPRLELLAVGAIVDPFARCGDPLAGGDDGGMAHDGHQIAVSARFRPEHAEAVFGVVEGDPLDEACENFLVDDSGVDFMRALGSPVLSSSATPRMTRGRSRPRVNVRVAGGRTILVKTFKGAPCACCSAEPDQDRHLMVAIAVLQVSQHPLVHSPNLHHHSVFAPRTVGVDVERASHTASVDVSVGRSPCNRRALRNVSDAPQSGQRRNRKEAP